MTKVQYYQDSSGQWRWRVRAANGRILADSSEGYYNRKDAEAGYRLVTEGNDDRTDD